MKTAILSLLAFTGVALAEEASTILLDAKTPNQIHIKKKDGTIMSTMLTTETHGRPYIHPLRSPDGKGVLTQFSPGHHKHQTGLYWGPTRINGRDYFHNYNKQFWANTKILPILTANGQLPSWQSSSDLMGKDGKVVLQETQQWTMKDHGKWYTLDLVWTAHAKTEVTVSKYPYGGLFLRMPWKRGVPAECRNSEGLVNQQGEGKAAKWVDLAMKIEGMDEMAHIAIIDHTSNAGHPTLWRIDGQFGIGPAFTRAGDVTIPKGEQKKYRYRLVVYQGEFNKELVDKQYAEYGKPAAPKNLRLGQ